MAKLRLTEIFFSLQGETNTVGLPTVFIRLTGCPLRCQYCDTAYAFQGGAWYDIATIMQTVQQYNTRYVTVSGGEPLAQPNCLPLLTTLCDANYYVSLETSGALDISAVDGRVSKIVDVKTPGSQEAHKNRWQNFDFLTMHDQVKFVICHEDDYHWAKQLIDEYQLMQKCPLLFSPSYGQLSATDLANWIVRDQLPVRIQIQLHKYLWGDVPGK